MSGFVIFVLVLTFVYVVYFAVMITLDLHGKKDEKKSEEDTYDVGDMTNEEQPSSTTSEELNEKNDEFLEHIEPEHQCSYLSEEFMQNLNNKHNTRKIEKKNARDKL